MQGPTDALIEIETGQNPELVVILMHGLGADGNDFAPLVPELRLPFAARFVFPNAPVRPITINNGMPMRAWFDILSFSRAGVEDVSAIRTSAETIETLVKAEIARGFRSQQIVLAGFSQGGAIALHTGLRTKIAIGGILGLSAFLPLAGNLAAEHNRAHTDLPVMMLHGSHDPVIELSFAEQSAASIKALGYNVDWRVYPMAHALCTTEIVDISKWLIARHAAYTDVASAD